MLNSIINNELVILFIFAYFILAKFELLSIQRLFPTKGKKSNTKSSFDVRLLHQLRTFQRMIKWNYDVMRK